METLRDTIRNITKKHLEENNGLILGQCLSAVGWVDNTVPNTKGVIELPMTDVAGADIAVGCAIAGIRPILVIRFQDFLMLNGNALVYFAAKRKEIFGKSVPIFVRALAKEGNGTGNSHSGKIHSTFTHFPGLRLYAPITSGEYQSCWNDFMANDDPAICFEHRDTFNNTSEYPDIIRNDAEITIIGISLARMNILSALSLHPIKTDMFKIIFLDSDVLNQDIIDSLKKTRRGLIVDTGYEKCSISRDFAYRYMIETGAKIDVLGIKQKSVGCKIGSENLTPSVEEILDRINRILE